MEEINVNSINYKLGYLHSAQHNIRVLIEKAKLLFERKEDKEAIFLRNFAYELEKEVFDLQKSFEAEFNER